jgi:ATP-dependent Clp protease protease subunit
VRLNSPGGEATEGVAIANLLRAHKATVRATVYGLAASAASVIAVAADTVSMAPGSMLMIHEASDIAFGDATRDAQAASTRSTQSPTATPASTRSRRAATPRRGGRR